MLIDAHCHIFPRVHGRIAAGPTRGLSYGRVAIGGRSQQVLPPAGRATAHTPEMLLAQMEWAGVDRAVLLQGPFYGGCNAYVRAAVARYPDRLVGAAHLDPWARRAQAAFAAIRARGGLSILKLECSASTGLCGLHPGARLDDGALNWLWTALVRAGWPLVLDLGAIGSASYQTEAVAALAARYPELRIVIAHLAQPNPAAEQDPTVGAAWQAQLALGRLPNVWFDLASLPAYVAAQESYPFPTVQRYLNLALAQIGAGKLLWGTDAPALLAFATYRQLADLARTQVRDLPAADQAAILGGNAHHLYWAK